MVVQIFVMAVGSLILAFYYSWKLTLLVLAFTPLLVIAGTAQTKFFTNFAVGEGKRFVDANALANEAIMNVRTVACLGKETFFINRFQELVHASFR